MCEGLQPCGVIAAKRITYRKDGKDLPTNALLDTFDTPALPSEVRAGYIQLKVQPYIPNPLRCYQCQKFGPSQWQLSQPSCLRQLWFKRPPGLQMHTTLLLASLFWASFRRLQGMPSIAPGKGRPTPTSYKRNFLFRSTCSGALKFSTNSCWRHVLCQSCSFNVFFIRRRPLSNYEVCLNPDGDEGLQPVMASFLFAGPTIVAPRIFRLAIQTSFASTTRQNRRTIC